MTTVSNNKRKLRASKSKDRCVYFVGAPANCENGAWWPLQKSICSNLALGRNTQLCSDSGMKYGCRCSIPTQNLCCAIKSRKRDGKLNAEAMTNRFGVERFRSVGRQVHPPTSTGGGSIIGQKLHKIIIKSTKIQATRSTCEKAVSCEPTNHVAIQCVLCFCRSQVCCGYWLLFLLVIIVVVVVVRVGGGRYYHNRYFRD